MTGRCPTCSTALTCSDYRELIKCPNCKDVYNVEYLVPMTKMPKKVST